MRMILKLRQLNRRQRRALYALTAACNAYDGTRYGCPADADRYYLLYECGRLSAAAVLFRMGETVEGTEVCELAAFTAPEARRRKCFERLAAAMGPVLTGKYVRYSVYDNPAAAAVLRKRGAEHLRDELMLRLDLKRNSDSNSAIARAPVSATARDLNHSFNYDSDPAPDSDYGFNCDSVSAPASDLASNSALHPEYTGDNAEHVHTQSTQEKCIIDYDSGHAYSAFGECFFRLDSSGQSAYVFGVQTYAGALRQGHAYRLLSELCEALGKRGVSELMLQVASDNLPALKLYAKLGMQETERLSLYQEHAVRNELYPFSGK